MSRTRMNTALPRSPVPIATGVAELVAERDRPDLITLMLNGVPSSCIDLSDPLYLDFEYLQYMAAVIDDLPPGTIDAVHLGAGACSLARWLDARRPHSRQLAVDVDAVLVQRVRQWFPLPRAPRLRLRAADAAETLATLRSASADVIVRDVFADSQIPRPVTTAAFASDVARVLREGGVYLANCADRPPLHVARAEVATIRTAFANVTVAAEPGVLRGRRYGNLVIVASHGAATSTLARRLRTLPTPARLLTREEAERFAGSSPPIR